MARIAGVDIPDNKRGEIGLTYIFGIGRRSAQKILVSERQYLDKKVRNGMMKNRTRFVRSLLRSSRSKVFSSRRSS